MTESHVLSFPIKPKELARALGLQSASSIYRWKRIPVGRVLTIESKFGIPREELRPDLYPPRRAVRRAHLTPTHNQKENRA